MKILQKGLALAVAVCTVTASLPMASAASTSDAHVITLASVQNTDGTYTHSAALDGTAVSEYDYTWHADPSEVHDEVKNAPAEYYTGTEPGDEDVYIAHDIYYYPELDTGGFVQVNYDGDQEWAYYYTAEGYEDYIFATLPVSGSGVPTSMMHSEEEAYENAVLHITQAGTYILEGEWHGQIWIDLGDTDDTFADPAAKVTIILNGVDVTCTVAPALVFYSVYECDNTWEEQDSWSAATDTAEAGANVIIADGSVNHFTGENIYRMLKTKYKSDDEQSGSGVLLQKKMRKMDGAFYSYVSMNIDGEEAGTGELNINAGFEGLGSELHLTINGGNVNISSQDDGINVNEDGVSVLTVNGGSLHILAGLGSEGDGIDSNGFLVINGGTVVSVANPKADSGMDSDCGSYINGGTVIALGSTMDWVEADDTSDSGQVTMNLRFSGSQSADEAIIVTDTEGTVVFAYDPDQDEIAGSNGRWYQGAIISCEGLVIGESYFVYVGGDVYGTEAMGVYDVSTVTGFTDDAKLQSYTGTNIGMGGFGGTGQMDGALNGRPDETFTPPQEGDELSGEDRGDGAFNGGQMGTRPDKDQGSDDDADKMEPPDGMGMGQEGQAADVSTYFFMSAKVNSFSGVTDSGVNQSGFTDVPSGAWYESAVSYVVQNGLMNGTGAATFSPDVTTTRGMLVTILYRLEGEPAVSSACPFSDVKVDSYYEDAVIWAAAHGVVNGYDNGCFGPEDNLTREQIAAILYRYAQYKEIDTSVTNADILRGYEDVGSISAYALSAMEWGCETGLINGTSSTILSPKGAATRAQVATLLMRYCQELGI